MDNLDTLHAFSLLLWNIFIAKEFYMYENHLSKSLNIKMRGHKDIDFVVDNYGTGENYLK